MPRDNKGRPDRVASGATKTVDDQDQQSCAAYDTAAGVRRRRAAASRLEPLQQGGRRDPLDVLPPPQAARCELHITIDRSRDRALVSGWRDRETVAQAGLQPRWSASAAGWCIAADAVADVLAEAARDNRFVVVHDGPVMSS